MGFQPASTRSSRVVRARAVSLTQTAVETVLADPHPAVGVRTLIERVHPEAEAMGEERLSAGLVQGVEPVPEHVIPLPQWHV